MSSTCCVCRKPIAGDFEDVGLQAVIHVFDTSKGWPHKMDGPPSVLQSHEGDCTVRFLGHLSELETKGIPS